ncbi:hypothetical protein EMIT0P265_410003 [Pseudomonas zeae]
MLAWLGLKAYNGLVGLGFQTQQKSGEDRVAAGVALLTNLPQEYGGRDPVRSGGLYALPQVVLERRKLAHALRARAIDDGPALGVYFDVASNGIARAIHLPSNGPNRQTLTNKNTDFHVLLLGQHGQL